MSWTDSPAGDYSNNADVNLQSPTIDLSAYAGQPLLLGFMAQYDLEDSYDKLIIQMSADNGVTWRFVGELTGVSNGWEYNNYAIPEMMKNTQFIVRFKLFSDSVITATGASVDNVGISVGTPLFPIDDSYAYFSGTSMAAPQVVGAIGLLQSQDVTRDWRQLKNLIISGGVSMNTKNQPTISNRRLRVADINGQGSMSCNNQIVQSRLRPTQDIIDIAAVSTSRLNLSYLHINCSEPAGNVIATIRETGQEIILLDDGVGIDQIAGDGVYSVSAALINITTSSVMVDFPNGDVLIVKMSSTYSVSETVFVSRALNTPEIINTGIGGFSVVTPPFNLNYAGETHPSVYVYQHGIVSLKLPRILGVGNVYNLRLPARNHEMLIAPFWAGLGKINGSVVHQTLGVAPNREFVIEWQNMDALFNSTFTPAADGATFQLIFFENSNNILVNYKDVTFAENTYNDGALATIGLQTSSSQGVTYSYEKAVVKDRSAILFEYIPAPALAPSPYPPVTKPGPATTPAPAATSGDGGGSLLWLSLILFGYYGLRRYAYSICV